MGNLFVLIFFFSLKQIDEEGGRGYGWECYSDLSLFKLMSGYISIYGYMRKDWLRRQAFFIQGLVASIRPFCSYFVVN